MKTFAQITLAASLVAGSAASHHHGHQHLHKKSNVVDKRAPDAVTEIVAGPTETVFVLDGKVVGQEEAAKGIKGGDYVVVGETVPTYSAPPPPPKPTSTSADVKAQFIEKTKSTTSTTTTSSTSSTRSSTSTSVAPTTTSSSSSAAASTTSSGSSYSPPSGGEGITAEFPDGEISCSTFPSDYGAISLDWLGFEGWSGIQQVPDFRIGALSISNIITGIAGSGCVEKSMCSYACPLGYQKAQWPSAQGSTKQSIGGLYCGSDNKLYRTNKDHKTLCISGEGGISIQNDLDVGVSTCRTDYPGSESMVIPAYAGPGDSIQLTNPDQNSYYQWDGQATSAQYYVNKAGYSVEDACCWNSPKDPKGAGNWAPINIGVGMSGGTTYLSIFLNQPTSTALLDFNIEITGDVTAKCAYKNGKFTGGTNGCTTGVPKGGKAVFRYFK